MNTSPAPPPAASDRRPSKTLLLVPLLAGIVHGMATAANPAPADIRAGQKAFAPCASCHQVGPSARSGFGPALNGIFGRRAGTLPGYSYSTAMKNSKIVWSAQSLTAFIEDAERTVPGTKMRFFSIGYDDQKIINLLAYLRTDQTSR